MGEDNSNEQNGALTMLAHQARQVGIPRYFVQLKADEALVHLGEPKEGIPLPARLTRNAQLVIKEETFTLGDVLDALIHNNEAWLEAWFDERGQYDTGVYLFRQLFGDEISPDVLKGDADWAEVCIVTDDEDIARIPWMLIAHHGVFLSTAGWSVGFNSRDGLLDEELPPSPRILVIAPQPTDWTTTERDQHLEELHSLLHSADRFYLDDEYYRVVHSWRQLVDLISDGGFLPNLLYYYGHGTGDQHTTRLVFEDQNGNAELHPVADLAALLQQASAVRPLVGYINCCQGDVGGWLGVGRQLSPLMPAVITNRTTAYISAAREQAMTFWEAVVLRGEAPHRALAGMRGRFADLGLSLGDPRWMTPVLHFGYDTWKANPTLPKSRLERDPHWDLKLDRVSQFGQIYYQTAQMFFEQKPTGLAYIWYGAPQQGVDLFHRRLKVELEEKLQETIVYEVAPEWPDELGDPHAAFRDMLLSVFGIHDMEQLSGRIRGYARGFPGKRVLVYIRHKPITSRFEFNPAYLKTYLHWWDTYVLPNLPDKVHGLLGISFSMEEPALVRQALVEEEQILLLRLKNASLSLLDELDKITLGDLHNFVRQHRIELPDDLIDREFDNILKQTECNYMQVLDRLRYLESRVWRESLKNLLKPKAEKKTSLWERIGKKG